MAPINTISRSVKYGLHYAASWPGAPLSVLCKLFWMIVLGVGQTHQYNYIIKHYKVQTLIEIIDNISICLPFSLVCIKLVIAWTHQGLLHSILSTMEEECQTYAVMDTNNLISKTAHWCYRLTNIIISTTIASTVFYVIGVFTSEGVNATTPRELLLKMDLPFDTSKSPTFELVIIVQYFYQASSAFIFAVFTGLLLMIVLHIGCQIDVMCQTSSAIPYKNEKQLKFFISRHQEIILFAEKIEKFFTYIALSQLITNTLIICCLGYLIVLIIHIENGFPMFMKCVVFYISVCSEAFVYCFAGEYLNIKSKLIADTAYEFLWYDTHPSKSRLLIPVILRSQRGFSFTLGKFANLSMSTFAAIMKASGSYISVLLAMT
ncbi:odorant receptor 13a-like isoform X1 [Bombus affinis]|uniref:odorant receptor 13a-like isoform X1 n=1 Tax=Bombus affinis TaxID=309941 RepID=UPI0021B72A3D|nr:odorant receptor 13a-like isoform X1 [Bombus affinis]XP_050600419.1 odorant receptor 13a-like isoform X1 [Bombus affinis]